MKSISNKHKENEMITTPTGRITRKYLFHSDSATYTFKHGLGSRAIVTVYDADNLQTYDASISRVDRDTVSIEMSSLDWEGNDNLVNTPIEHGDLVVIARAF
jgi:hypothetical protein